MGPLFLAVTMIGIIIALFVGTLNNTTNQQPNFSTAEFWIREGEIALDGYGAPINISHAAFCFQHAASLLHPAAPAFLAHMISLEHTASILLASLPSLASPASSFVSQNELVLDEQKLWAQARAMGLMEAAQAVEASGAVLFAAGSAEYRGSGSGSSGSRESKRRAMELFMKGAATGHANCEWRVGWMHYLGDGVSQSDDEAFMWFFRAAMQGHADAVHRVTVLLSQSHRYQRQYRLLPSTVAELYTLATTLGHPEAVFHAGLRLYAPNRNETDWQLACEYFKMAAELGHSAAQVLLGSILLDGVGCLQNQVEARELLQLAFKKHEPLAAHLLGDIFYFGLGTEPDTNLALYFYNEAADLGHADAQYFLGDYYSSGSLPIDRNPSAAVQYLYLAATQSHMEAQYWYGKMRIEGIGISENFKDGYKWIQRAAGQGHLNAIEYISTLGNSGSTSDFKQWFVSLMKNTLTTGKVAIKSLLKQVPKND
jgi:TPR repeat protein